MQSSKVSTGEAKNTRTISRILIAATLLVIIVGGLAAVDVSRATVGPGTVYYLGKDTITKGNWTNAVGSPLGVYGSYAHILPNCPVTSLETPVGNFSVPVSPFTFTSYGWPPWQQAGLPFNRTEPPYWDEYVSLMPTVNYTLKGTLYPMPTPPPPTVQWPVFEWAWDSFGSSDLRAAYFETNVAGVGGPGYRLTCWDDGGERGFPSDGYFNVTLSFPNEVFMLSLYAYDKEEVSRDNQMINITNTAGAVLASGMMAGSDFDAGVYLQFIVYGPTTIVVQVKKSASSINAVLSGIFVDKLSHNLDAEPPGLFLTPDLAKQWNTLFNSSFDLAKTLNTTWDELYPAYGTSYNITRWCDANNDGILDSGDFVGLIQKVPQDGAPYWWRVDNVTVTMKVARWPSKDEMFYLELNDSWPGYTRAIVLPNGTEWYEVYPQYGPAYCIERWKDNCDSRLDYCDNVTLRNEDTGELADYHVEMVKTDLIVTSRTTQVILGPTKDFVGEEDSQVIPVTIESYEPDTTNFTVCAYYDGLNLLGKQTLILSPLDSGDAIFTWAGPWQKGTYNHDITINVYRNGTLFFNVTFPITFKVVTEGDVNGDGVVDMSDVGLIANAYGSSLNEPRYNPNGDITGDCFVDMSDLSISAMNYGHTDP